MRFEFLVALRYLRAKREQAFISVISLLSVLGVALGVAALIIVLGVMNGFSENLRDKILGLNAHIVVGSHTGTIADYQDMAGDLEEIAGVRGATPFIYSEVMLSTPSGVKGVVLRGIDPQGAKQVLGLDQEMVQGGVLDLEIEKDFPGLIIGQELAANLRAGTGDTVNVMAPSGEGTSAGFTPSITTFDVRGVFRTGMYEYDTSFAYTTINDAQELMGFTRDVVSGMELRVHDADRARELSERVSEKLGGYPYYVRNWKEMNENLFAALELEKIAMGVILAMIVLVGSFSIITALVMLVMEKTRDIAILMSMGTTRRMIRNIFVLLGLMIGGLGTALGFAVGLGGCYILENYKFIRLPADVYFMEYLPVLLHTSDLIIIAVAAMVLCFLATIYPARKASGLNPSEALRHE
ncbi:lipoprotein releasing system, transmembrane protein, LolC/E family [Desulfonatronospira thiodismutans ASO3-1]|uniref:Lipoprotein releasing system, transmembrane protein, LolC/E family n=1 Tax=Desulfonatronospira thiodismutans ASO3-1 TaxID=555779 RepID=D6SPA8_9BACT|nr:lipoprotein-releasing ABC transporter permease subunit [Desulfonatronospira thiodismutans]EFI34584.1 lipoprotein releasing system, transmembrane protein, LolC/E family [Desulfonatronospira thiodismutans ASO3-1]